MAILVKDSTSLDANGNSILWGDTVKKVLFYSAEDESWDRTGGGTASWYLENTLPSDSFVGPGLSSERWSFFNYRGTVSGTVDSKLFLTVSGSDARGGISSEDKWKLSGDFDIRLYFDESAYYNEYRADSATGLTISYDESNKIRVSKYFSRLSEEIGYSTDYVDTFELAYVGWTQDAFSTSSSLGEDDITCLRITRDSGVIKTFVSTSTGFTQLGSDFSGGNWSNDLDVEIELETGGYNFYSSDILGFSVSGTLATSSEFSSAYRGPSESFPERSLMVVDDYGLSILEADSLSLWMRFRHSEDYMYRYTGGNIAAANGRIYYTTASGLVCLDFPNDRAVWYTDTEKKETRVGLAQRNFKNSFYNTGSASFILNDNCLDVDAVAVGSNEFVAVATCSGLGLLINQTDEKTESSTLDRIQTVELSDQGSMYWNYYDTSTSRGKLFYRDSVVSLVGDPGSTFTPTGYYSADTTPIQLSSENINDISVNQYLSNKVLLSHSFGLDYIANGVCTAYGPVVGTNPISDGSFSSDIGVYWFLARQSLFNVFDVFVSDGWFTSGTQSVKLKLYNTGMVTSGEYGGFYQSIDLTGIDALYFDYKLVNSAPDTSSSYIKLVVSVNGTEVFSAVDSTSSYVSLDNVLDVSWYSGVCTVMFVVEATYSGSILDYNSFYVDNVRIVPVDPEYKIIPTSTHSITEAVLWYNSSERKIFFAAQDGYGAIDIDSNTLDYFNKIDDIVPLSYIVSAEYVEYVDAV